MSIDKNVPPYVAHFDGNQVPTMMGVEGTLGTTDSGGTARPLPIAVNPATGAMYVQDLAGASGTTNVVVVGGTLNAGTVTTSLALNSGTISTIAAGTQNTLGTVGTIIGLGTATNLGSVTNVGSLDGVGIVTRIGNIGTVESGSVQITNTPTVNVTQASFSAAQLGTVGTVIGIGTITNLGSITNVGNSGTTTGVGVVTTVTTLSNLTNGTTRISVGTITTGSLTNLAGLHTGTITTIAAGTQNTLGTVGVVNNIVTGTLANSGTTTGVGVVGNLNDGTVHINAQPGGSAVLTSHTLGTGGGTFFGTLIAPQGAGTYIYLTGFSIVARSGGTIDVCLANNVAGTTGAGVIFRGAIPTAGGGIARDLNPALRLGTNGTLAYALITAGTADISYTYWVGP